MMNYPQYFFEQLGSLHAPSENAEKFLNFIKNYTGARDKCLFLSKLKEKLIANPEISAFMLENSHEEDYLSHYIEKCWDKMDLEITEYSPNPQEIKSFCYELPEEDRLKIMQIKVGLNNLDEIQKILLSQAEAEAFFSVEKYEVNLLSEQINPSLKKSRHKL